MADDLRISDSVTIPGDELEESFSTSGGPGGQHANRSNTRVELRWVPSASRIDSDILDRIVGRLDDDVILVSVSESRSQFRNRQLARQRLKEHVVDLLKPERRLDDKSRRSQVKRQRRKPDIE